MFAVSLALVFHFHYLFAVFVLIPGLVIWNHGRGGGRVDVRGLVGWLALSALLLLPLIPLARILANGLYGVRVDAWVFASMAAPLAIAILAAALVPARRAAWMEPTVALRDD